MPSLVIAIGWLLLLSSQSPLLSDKQAVVGAQQLLASELDAELPKLRFADWFRQVVGAGAGVTWQLNECGEQPSLLIAQGRAIPACAEVNALLPDGRKVVIMIEVGSFKTGISGNPSFSYSAIEQEGELYPVRRLRDLPQGLGRPAALRDRNSIKFVALDFNMHSPPEKSGGKALYVTSADEAIPPPPVLQPTTTPAEKPAPPPMEPRRISEGVLRGSAIVKVQPLYPESAKKMQAAGSVQVQVMISEEGRVIEVMTVSGHPLLRKPVVDAARKWVFKPTLLNGIPVKVESTLTFVFTLNE
ncbi:MAG: energy transducer TonB [Acidobacteria bacterium]|nr:energy transducer TonB [Acidobacteriota bacterium]